MLSEMIDSIVGLSAETDKLDLLYETPRKRVYDDRGAILIDPKDTPERRHQVYSLPCLVAAMKSYTFDEGDVSLWVSESEITVILNDGSEDFRDDQLSMILQISPFFAVLAKSAWFDQKKMIDMLRHDLCGTVIEPKNTLDLLRNLKFSTSSETTGQIDNNSAAMGKSALAQVTGADRLPETVKVEFCPYPALRELLESDVTIDCTLFTDATSGGLRLAPRPGELEAAKLAAMQQVQKKLVSMVGTVPVYLGSP